jgi:acetoacetyl-CoA synthetase
MSLPIWKPSPERAAASSMARFRDELMRDHRLGLPPGGGLRAMDYDTLWRWSIEHPARFWPAVWRFCDVRASRPFDRVLVDGTRMPGARWFEGAQLNFAENLLKGGLLRVDDDRPALVACDERGRRRELSWRELRERVRAVAAALRADGVAAGDRVAGFLPNTLEPVIAMLATTSLGAIWSSCSPDFGLDGAVDRFGQIEPRVLFACDGYTYNGRPVDTRERVAQIRQALPGLRRVVMVPFLAQKKGSDPFIPKKGSDPFIPKIGSDPILFDDYRGDGPLEFAQLPFDHPLCILYSSGTTGRPKCIVHGAGGTLLQHLKELVLHSDVRAGDRLFFFTTCGWMMWNWLVSGLAAGATVVLYDGAPLHPGPEALWDLAETERLTQLGVSPKYLGSVEKSGFKVRERYGLRELRTILSTGSPLAPEQFDFVYRDINADVQLASISGGTDIISCFALGNPQLPVYRGELQCRGLGMAVDVYDERGRPARGEPGELVCTKPFPSMPLGFWNDPDGARYRAAYFDRFPGAWHHGDWAQLTPTGGLVISGRSDATLNPGGVRIGTGEIYRVVDALPEVLESVVVAHRHDNDDRVILFVRLRDGITWSEPVQHKIRGAIKSALTPRHVPAQILPCPEVPRTISGKITELAVRELIHGRPVKNADALANPQALDYFRNLPQESLF